MFCASASASALAQPWEPVLLVAAILAGGAGLVRLAVMLLVVVKMLLVVREPCEIVVVGGLEVGSHGCDWTLQRHA